jgi:hypothetical protein
VNPQLKLAFGLLWDALASAAPIVRVGRNGTLINSDRYSWAMEIINEWVRSSDRSTANGSERTLSAEGQSRSLASNDGSAHSTSKGQPTRSRATVQMSHTSWVHGFGPNGCCPAGIAQGDGCPIMNNSLPPCWNGTGAWNDDDGRFPGDMEGDEVVWIRRHAEGHSLVLQAVGLLETHGETANPTWLEWVVSGAESLLALQRRDGSWGRAYRLEASASDPPFDKNSLLDK